MNAEYWLDTATSKIRFAPDRKAVRRELRDHLEDRMEAGKAKGLSAYEAEQAATAAIGDPAALAEELAKVHSPWWGWLWRLSQWALAIAVLVTVFSAVPRLWEDIQYEIQDPPFPLSVEEGSYTREYYADYTKEITVPEVWDISGSADLGHYRFTVSGAWVEEWTVSGEGIGDPYAVRQLVITLKASTWRFWEPLNDSQFMILDNMATNDGSKVYYYGVDPPAEAGEQPLSLFCETFQRGAVTWLRVELNQTRDMDSWSVPDWVDIPVGYGGDVLRVDLSKGVIS